MKKIRLSHLAVLLAAIGCASLPEITNIGANKAYAEEALRADVGKVVQAAATLYKERKFKEALSKIREADSLSGKSAHDTFTVERMRLSIALQAGDNDSTIRAAEAIVASNKLTGKDQLQMIQVLANGYFKAANYSKATQYYQRYFAEGGTDQSLRPYMIQAMSQGGDSAKAIKEVQADIAASEKAGHPPSQANLEFLANVYLRQKNVDGYNATLEKLIVYHGKREYWANLLSSLQRKNTFNQRLLLDLYRLKLALGQLKQADEFMEFSQLALQAGLPNEGIKIIDAGYKAEVLGVGPQAGRHKRLLVMANSRLTDSKNAAAETELEAKNSRDGNGLVNQGYNLVTIGQYDKGIALMEAGFAKGGLRYPEDAKLHLAIALLQSGKKADAIKIFKTVQGTDGSAELAHLWVVFANQSK